MKQFEANYLNPSEVKAEGFEPIHLLKIKNEKGETVGFAELQYFGGKPSFYYLQNLGNTTTDENKEKGVGNKLVSEINSFLDSKKICGYLANTSKHPDLYTNRGWKPSRISSEFNYYGDLTEQEELAILERLTKHFSKISK